MRSRTAIIVGGVLLVGGAAAGYSIWSTASVLDASVTRQVHFPVYVPKNAPKGFALQEGATTVTDSTVTYSFVDGSGKMITVTVQPRPSSLDMRRMIEGGAVHSSTLDTGTLYDLSADGASKYMLDMGDSLVFITSPQAVNSSMVSALAADLRRAN